MLEDQIPEAIFRAPFEADEHGQIAIKAIDDRGNELLVANKDRPDLAASWLPEE